MLAMWALCLCALGCVQPGATRGHSAPSLVDEEVLSYTSSNNALQLSTVENFPPQEYQKMLRPGASTGKPDVVTISLQLRNVLDIDEKMQASQVDINLLLKWEDPRLRWNVKEIGVLERRIDPDSIWMPGMDVANQLAWPKKMREVATVLGDNGLVVVKRRLQVLVSNSMNFVMFPFDSHNVTIDMGSFFYTVQDIQLKTDSTQNSMAEDLSHSQFAFTEFSTELGTIYGGGGDATDKEDTYAAFKVKLSMVRKPSFIYVNFILPCVATVLMACSSYYFSESRFDVKVGVSTGALLTSMFLMYVLLDSLPNIGYFTLMHAFLGLSMLTTTLSLVYAVWRHQSVPNNWQPNDVQCFLEDLDLAKYLSVLQDQLGATTIPLLKEIKLDHLIKAGLKPAECNMLMAAVTRIQIVALSDDATQVKLYTLHVMDSFMQKSAVLLYGFVVMVLLIVGAVMG